MLIIDNDVGLDRWTVLSFVGGENKLPWSSTTCKMNCFCSAFLVIEELECWVRATLRSATSLTTLINLQIARHLGKSSWLIHTLGSSPRNASGRSKIRNRLTVVFVTNSCSPLVDGWVNRVMRFSGYLYLPYSLKLLPLASSLPLTRHCRRSLILSTTRIGTIDGVQRLSLQHQRWIWREGAEKC